MPRLEPEPCTWRAHKGPYDCVTFATKPEAIRLLGTEDVHIFGDHALIQRAKRHRGKVLRRVRGVKKSRYEVWGV